MLVLDNDLLSDYLDGTDSARQFLSQYEEDVWAVPSIVLYEAYMGSIHGYIDGSPETIRHAITTSMDVLDVTEQTADTAASLQDELLSRGVPADHPDALIAASAREHRRFSDRSEALLERRREIGAVYRRIRPLLSPLRSSVTHSNRPRSRA